MYSFNMTSSLRVYFAVYFFAQSSMKQQQGIIIIVMVRFILRSVVLLDSGQAVKYSFVLQELSQKTTMFSLVSSYYRHSTSLVKMKYYPVPLVRMEVLYSTSQARGEVWGGITKYLPKEGSIIQYLLIQEVSSGKYCPKIKAKYSKT